MNLRHYGRGARLLDLVRDLADVGRNKPVELSFDMAGHPVTLRVELLDAEQRIEARPDGDPAEANAPDKTAPPSRR